MLQLETIDPRILGLRLAEARKARGVTQEDVSAYLNYSRPTYIAIEKGERPAKAEEIVKLAAYFGRKVSNLFAPVSRLLTSSRTLRGGRKDQSGRPARTAGGDRRSPAPRVRLPRVGADDRAPLRYNYPPPVTLETPVDVAELADSVASQERRRLGLGEQPVEQLRRLLEWDVGLRIFYWPLPSAIAGMYAYADDLGCCIMVNRKHPAERRRVSMLHEYGHLIVDRYKPGIDYLDMPGRKPANERFAEAFAVSFLMPANAVRQRFHEIVAATKDFQVADLCRLSHFFFVSVEAMALRLEQLALIPKGSWELIKESKFAPRQAAQLLGLQPQSADDHAFPERYVFLAVNAYEKGEIGDADLAHYLRSDIVTAREIAAKARTCQEIEAKRRGAAAGTGVSAIAFWAATS